MVYVKFMNKMAVISILSLFNVVTSFLFQIYLASTFGIGIELDLYFLSGTINIIISSIITSGVNNSMVPVVIKHFNKGNYKDGWRIINTIISFMSLIYIVLMTLQITFSTEIISIMGPGLDETQVSLASQMFQIQAIISLITINNGFLNSVNYVHERFFLTIIATIFSTLINLLFVVVFQLKLGIMSVVYGYLIGQIVQTILLSIKYWSKLRISIKLDANSKNVLLNMLPLFFSSSISKTGIFIDRFLASQLLPGSITLLSYGQRIVSAINEVLIKAFSLTSLTSLSHEYSKDNIFKFKQSMQQLLVKMFIIIIPVIIGLFLYGHELISLVFVRGNFLESDAHKLSIIIILMIGSFVGGSLNSVLANCFYIFGETKFVSKISIFTHVLSIFIKIILFYALGVFGLALSISISSILVTLLLSYGLVKRVGLIINIKMLLSSLLIMILSLASAFFSMVITRIFNKILFFGKYIVLFEIILTLSIFILSIISIPHIKKVFVGKEFKL